MNDNIEKIPEADRKDIAIRFCFSILFLLFFELAKTIVQVAVLFQYIYLFVTKRRSEPVRKFSNKAAVYAYRALRYASLNENMKPFPFSEMPPEMEPPETDVRYK
jgi:hypothetical protein